MDPNIREHGVLRGVLHRDDPAWERWLRYEILSSLAKTGEAQEKIMKAIEDLEKAVARVTAAAEGLHAHAAQVEKEHAECPTHDEVQEAADALHWLADKLEGTKAAAPAAST